jgi:hypothetical protein
MKIKNLFIILGVIVTVIAAIVVCLFVYMQQHLYLPDVDDTALVERFFPPDFPGYSNVEILSSKGEGMRRIPREIEVAVQIESYPQAVRCQGQIYLVDGDPMMQGVRWQTLQCVGQRRTMELAQLALERGFDYSKCHNERVALLLARWVRSGLTGMDKIMFPAVKEKVSALVADPNLLTLQPALDGGLFDTSKIIVRDDVKGGNAAGQRSSFILRCDGRLEQFRIDPGLIHNYTEFAPEDYLLPDPIEPMK